MKVLRLSDGCAVVPAHIVSVEVVPRYERYEFSPMSFRPVQSGHNVIVRHLMVEAPQTVASFGPSTTRNHPGFGSAPLYDDAELARLLVESEARAYAVYETILQAIKEEAA